MKLPLEKSDQKMSQHMRTSKTGKVFTAGVGTKAQPKVMRRVTRTPAIEYNPKLFSFKLKDARNQYAMVVYSVGKNVEDAKNNLKRNIKNEPNYNNTFKKISSGNFLGRLNDTDPEEIEMVQRSKNGLAVFEPEPINS